ncbi:ABC transporter permease [Companilactobacillus huachuanensis]|uniref:ABC transporter permease n=1 Tax=Companilactobacillus huachuanensis TaxID=2559914 RepID=A0ABW1RQL6_9LACO|nr:ABC transporter permease [Companilactobacillus huachuanensis]
MKKIRSFKFNNRDFIKNNSPLMAFLALFLFAMVVKGRTFFNLNNIMNILLNNSIIGIIALGMMLIIITSGIDLSVGSLLAVTGIVDVFVLNSTGSIFLSLASAIAVGSILGLFTGTLVARFAIPSFIVTLGTMRIYRSVAEYGLNGGGILATGNNNFTQISNGNVFGIPYPVLFWLVVSIVVSILVNKTAFGRHIYSVGSNSKASFLAGINVKKVLILVYVIAGVLVAIASILEASRLGSMNSSSSGTNYEMDAIAATVIGGTAMMGGKGSVVGTTFGTLTLGIINNLMNLLGMNAFWVGAVKGAIIIAAVLMQMFLNRKERN